MLICGVDEAGRGCVMGSLIVAATVFKEEILDTLQVADSKKLSKKRREALDEQIQQSAHEISIVELTAQNINDYHRQGLTLNQMEVLAFTKALNQLNSKPDEIYMDAADVNPDRFRDNIMKNYKYSDDVPIVAEHKADDNIDVVAAASIVAKVERDRIMATIANVSGYGDVKTQKWLKEYYMKNGKFPDDCRFFWKTLDNIKKSCQ